MQITFIGDGEITTTDARLYGHVFPINEPVEADLTDAQVTKLRGNATFSVGEPEKAPAKGAAKAVAASVTPAQPQPAPEPEAAPEPAPAPEA